MGYLKNNDSDILYTKEHQLMNSILFSEFCKFSQKGFTKEESLRHIKIKYV